MSYSHISSGEACVFGLRCLYGLQGAGYLAQHISKEEVKTTFFSKRKERFKFLLFLFYFASFVVYRSPRPFSPCYSAMEIHIALALKIQ